VFADLDPRTYNLDPASVEACVTPRTRAILAVHLAGNACDLRALKAVADRHELLLIEDCAQAHGAALGERPAGTLGELGCFSFYPTKNLAALGDAGAVITSDPGLAAAVRAAARYGASPRGVVTERGFNSRLDELQAAVLRVRLPLLDAANRRRAQIATRYDAALADTPVQPLKRLADRRHVFHQYVVRAPERDGFRAALARMGVDTLVHYDRPVHGHAPYRGLADARVPLTESERLAETVVSLPIHPALTDGEVEHAASAARAAALGEGA
jgi:dTDP-4-amino-4,6-dideoxygalactose transaminase